MEWGVFSNVTHTLGEHLLQPPTFLFDVVLLRTFTIRRECRSSIWTGLTWCESAIIQQSVSGPYFVRPRPAAAPALDKQSFSGSLYLLREAQSIQGSDRHRSVQKGGSITRPVCDVAMSVSDPLTLLACRALLFTFYGEIPVACRCCFLVTQKSVSAFGVPMRGAGRFSQVGR